MNRTSKAMCSLVILAILLAGTGPLQAGASEGGLTILFTHDLHDHLTPYRVQLAGEVVSLGGFARLQQVILAEKAKDPQLLLVDAGDFSMGTLFQTIFSSHAPQLRLLGQLGYDATTFGNHEFDYRASGLAESLKAAQQSGAALPQIVASNMIFPEDERGRLSPSLQQLKEATDDFGVLDYLVLERGGFKVGIFGLMGKDAASNAPMSEVDFGDPLEEARRVVALLQSEEEVDLILCLSHSGTEGRSPKTEDELLAKEVPEIDLIISGHSHTELPQPLLVGSTIIASCGQYGINLGILRVVPAAQGRWELVDYNLKRIDQSIAEDEEIARQLQDYEELVQQEYLDDFGLEMKQVLAFSPFSFTSSFALGAEHREEPLGNLIGDAYIYAVQQAEGADYEPIAASIVPAGTIRGSFVQGQITTEDVFIVSSLGIGRDGIPGYPLVSVYLSGKELKTLCEVDASVAPLMSAAQLYVSGLSYTFNPRRLIFNKVTEVALRRPDGSLEELDEQRLYRVVAGLYSGQMLPAVSEKSFGLLSLVPKTRTGEAVLDFEEQIILDYSLGEGREIKEWHAIAQYLQSFEAQDGLPVIPGSYSDSQGRKNIEQSLSPWALLKNPNKISLAIYLLLLLFILGLSFAVQRRIKRRRLEARKIYR